MLPQVSAVLPIILDPAKAVVGLAGRGERLKRRRALLVEAGITPRAVQTGSESGLAGMVVLYIAGLERQQAAALAAHAKALGVLVNVEDEPHLSDFHVPAAVRRGDLLLTVSSAGRSPGLARVIREWLADRFGPEWGKRVEDAGNRRAAWRAEGKSPSEIAQMTRTLSAGWLV